MVFTIKRCSCEVKQTHGKQLFYFAFTRGAIIRHRIWVWRKYKNFYNTINIYIPFYVKTQKMHMFYWKVNEIQSNFYWKVNKLYKNTKRLAERGANFLCYLYFARQKCLWLWDKICNRYKLNIEKTAFQLFLAEMRHFYSQVGQSGL